MLRGPESLQSTVQSQQSEGGLLLEECAARDCALREKKERSEIPPRSGEN